MCPHVFVLIRWNAHVHVVGACKQSVHAWGPVPPHAMWHNTAHTNTTTMRIDKHTHTHTPLCIHITVFVSTTTSTRTPRVTCCCAIAVALPCIISRRCNGWAERGSDTGDHGLGGPGQDVLCWRTGQARTDQHIWCWQHLRAWLQIHSSHRLYCIASCGMRSTMPRKMPFVVLLAARTPYHSRPLPHSTWLPDDLAIAHMISSSKSVDEVFETSSEFAVWQYLLATRTLQKKSNTLMCIVGHQDFDPMSLRYKRIEAYYRRVDVMQQDGIWLRVWRTHLWRIHDCRLAWADWGGSGHSWLLPVPLYAGQWLWVMLVTQIFLVAHGSIYLFGGAATIIFGTHATYKKKPLWRVVGGGDNFCWHAVAFSWATRVTYKKYPYTK